MSNKQCVVKLAKKLAKRDGLKGRLGGWLYRTDGLIVCQGYFDLSRRYMRKGRIVDCSVENGVLVGRIKEDK